MVKLCYDLVNPIIWGFI